MSSPMQRLVRDSRNEMRGAEAQASKNISKTDGRIFSQHDNYDIGPNAPKDMIQERAGQVKATGSRRSKAE